MLIDAGPLIAILDDRDDDHRKCTAVLVARADQTLVTTWACIAEANYMLGRNVGIEGQLALLSMISESELLLHELTASDCARVQELMDKYRDLPMDLGDATLVVAAEKLSQDEIFTLDHHFHIYRRRDQSSFRVVS